MKLKIFLFVAGACIGSLIAAFILHYVSVISSTERFVKHARVGTPLLFSETIAQAPNEINHLVPINGGYFLISVSEMEGI